MVLNSGFYAVVATQTIDFITAGITADNTIVIFLLDGCPKSYIPNRGINAIEGFEAGKGYYISVKSSIDLGNIISNESVNLSLYLLNDYIPLYLSDEMPCPTSNITYVAKDIGNYLNLKKSNGNIATYFAEVRHINGDVEYNQPVSITLQEYTTYSKIFFNYKASTDEWIKTFDNKTAIDLADHIQNSPSNTWIVNHNSGKKRDLQLFSLSGEKIIGDVLQITDNQTIAQFLTPVAGYARII